MARSAPALGGTSSPTTRRNEEAAGFLEGLGQRVKAERTLRGLSRKALSDRSGISERYIAQLEGGEGNISVVLLWNLARSMGVSLEQLIVGRDGGADVMAGLVRRLRQADAATVQRIQNLLEQPPRQSARCQRFALIGLRGAGKSTLGRLAARDLNVTFIELKDEIEGRSGLDLEEIFSLFGQDGYRRLERQCLEHVTATHDRVVLAVAGGIVSDSDTYQYLLGHYTAVWVRAQPGEHMERVLGQGDRRPMADNPAAMDELRDILASRHALYDQAPLSLDTSGRQLEDSRRDLVRLMRGHLS